MKTNNPAGIDKTASSLWLSDKQIKALNARLSGETQIITQLILNTGFKFSVIRNSQWDNYNARLATLRVKGKAIKLPVATNNLLKVQRLYAKAEGDKIFNIEYKSAWRILSRAFYAEGIDQSAGIVKVLKLTFARAHFLKYRSKTKLAKAMGISSTRWIPRAVFADCPAESFFNFK